jgi:hypothetical protein
MLDAYEKLGAHAPSPQHIIPGHDPLVMRQYPAPRPQLEGVVARLDVMRELARARRSAPVEISRPPL